EKFADYWNKDNVHIDRVVYLPIVEDTVRIANLKSGGLDLIERVLATDIKDVRSDRGSGSRPRSGSAIWALTSMSGTASGRKIRSAVRPRCARRSITPSTARRSIRSCSTANSFQAING